MNDDELIAALCEAVGVERDELLLHVQRMQDDRGVADILESLPDDRTGTVYAAMFGRLCIEWEHYNRHIIARLKNIAYYRVRGEPTGPTKALIAEGKAALELPQPESYSSVFKKELA